MKNVTVGECKTGKKKKTKFKSVGGECKSGKKKKQSSKALENASLEKKLKKSGDGKDIIKKD